MRSDYAIAYMVLWVSYCCIALAILQNDRQKLIPELKEYLRFLCVPWKLAIFIPACLFVTFAGRFTNDETWDVVTGFGMSILTYATAPWAIGLVYQVVKGRRPRRYIVVSIALCLFSSSWFYDGYLYCRDGAYTVRWLGNLILSPIIYLAAGQMWNLEIVNGRFVAPSYLRTDWPAPPIDKRFGMIFYSSLPLIVIAAFVLVGFVRWHF